MERVFSQGKLKMILAKSNPPETLEAHTKNVLSVLKSVKSSFPNVPRLCNVEEFWDLLFYSLLLHDFGKAAKGFQDSLKDGPRWHYRHEILSAGFVSFLNYSEFQKDAIGMAIITHHKDVKELRNNYSTNNRMGKKWYEDAKLEMRDNFHELSQLFSRIPDLSQEYLGYRLDNFDRPTFGDLQDTYRLTVTKYYDGYDNSKKATQIHGKLGIFLKGFLTACDHLASAHRYEIMSSPKLSEILKRKFEHFNEIQTVANEVQGDTFLIAPTGYGKTEAALLWSDINQTPERSRRLFYFLPYTASINAIYQRLKERIFENDEVVGVEHGKASYFLYKEFGDSDDYLTKAREVREIQSLTKKIYRPIKILTPFQILKAFFGYRGFEQQLSELVNGLIVVDEVHAYDVRTSALMLEMFSTMKMELGCSYIIMSATIPSFLKEIYMKELNIANQVLVPTAKLQTMKRHKISILEGSILDNAVKIQKFLEGKKRVLVMCNTVDRAREVYDKIKRFGKKPMLIHGRFTLEDREIKEKALFSSEQALSHVLGDTDNFPIIDLLVGTQVIEVSLDIDYDVLFSEPAPIDALIQRFGRVNRKPEGKKEINNVFVTRVGSDLDKYVYKDQDRVKLTIDLLEQEKEVSEAAIQEMVDKVYKGGYVDDEKRLFDDVRRQFNTFREKIVPFIDNERKGDFYDLFDTVEVVPLSLYDKHQTELKEKRYLEAMKYAVRINIKQYKVLEKNGFIEKDGTQLYTSAHYDSEFGLGVHDRGGILGIFNT